VDTNGEALEFWTAAERVGRVRSLYAEGHVIAEGLAAVAVKAETPTEARLKVVQGWMPVLGPCTATDFANRFGVSASFWLQGLLEMEMAGTILRGRFCGPDVASDGPEKLEWCERNVLRRIHRRTVNALRAQVEPVSAAVYMEWLLSWQHLTAQTQLSGESGVLEAIAGLAGFEAPAIAWETELLPRRVANYDPRWLDALCLGGRVGWGRFSPHPALTEERAASALPRAIVPTSMAPITFFLREDCEWMTGLALPPANGGMDCFSPNALAALACLRDRGACFVADLVRWTKLTRHEAERALWELAAGGLATADGFDNLRALIDPRRRSVAQLPREVGGGARKAHASGRWCLLRPAGEEILTAGQLDEALASTCRTLLRRYGVLFRELLARENVASRWKDVLAMLRRMEARGEVRGGRFVTGVSGEQYCLPEVMASLRESKQRAGRGSFVEVPATDPVNLAGILTGGERMTATPGRVLALRDGFPVSDKPVDLHACALQQTALQTSLVV
jgi:ATP-dependent Lhr-like helicase